MNINCNIKNIINNLIITLNNTFLTILKLVSKNITNNSGLETTRAINVEKHSKSANYIFNNFIQIEIRSSSCKVNDVISQQQPFVIKLYNQHVGDVDRMGQNISKYRIAMPERNWYFFVWFCICLIFLSVMLGNCKKICDKNEVVLLQFRRYLARPPVVVRHTTSIRNAR